MANIDTSTWSADADRNTEIEGIPLGSNASITQTWKAIAVLMAAFKGDTDAIRDLFVDMEGATAQEGGASGLVPAPSAGDQNKLLRGDGTWSELDANQIPSLDAAKITSGTIDLARIPAGAIERLVPVADQAARFALTTADVQLGDTVKEADTGLLYFVVDTDHLDSEAGYAVYTAGAATAVAWSGVTGKPTTIAGYGITDAKIENGVITLGSNTITPLTSHQSLDNYVTLNGEQTITGKKAFSALSTFDDQLVLRNTGTIRRNSDDGMLRVMGGSSSSSNAYLAVNGNSNSSKPGCFIFHAQNSTQDKAMNGYPDGTLTWNGQAIQTSSDERMKTPIASVPDAVLDAWGEVQWGQFRYLEAVEAKGANARLHLGLIAQRVKAVFDARGLDACAYGILCHEEKAADENEPAADIWMLRYAEAQAMESAFQRRRADRLEARIAVLEEKVNV